MQSFNPIHLIVIIAIVVLGLGLIFKGSGNEADTRVVVATAEKHVAKPALPLDVNEISRHASDIPPPITRTENKLVEIELETQEFVAEMMPGVTYKYWTYNGTVPGPFLRVKEGDDVRITLTHGVGGNMHGALQVESFATVEEAEKFIRTNVAHADDGQEHGGHAHEIDEAHGHNEDAQETDAMSESHSHAAEGHATHSIDLHAVTGPGGGAEVSQVGHDGPKSFQFKASHAGIYVYHCASPHVPTHIANGMYGMILVEPEEGMEPVDKEFYVMQGDFYTKGEFGQKGHQEFDKDRLLAESPTYFAFNGRVGALTGDRAMRASVGDKIRMYVGVGSHVPSSFHVIGEIFDNLYSYGAITSEPLHNVQTTIIPAGGATMVEFTVDVPGTYMLVDHTLTRSIDKGAIAELVVEGAPQPELYSAIE